ncbi:hypothetical protein H6G33_16165 [Calothrix sp. FACHB-1219]|uniref:hypothetical protein n=1 Tax=unclassified Calothrix TaxID=2619626 RepID=UPI0016823A6E|nr:MULTISPECIES: hypothetical protein [unclassified Calothrix]MBD2206753.1 hypothetical protein [Calothrix sp. FACHB-168]MBD2218571.1 hypothetical protein [Calothrix sp. FACHB-1219]
MVKQHTLFQAIFVSLSETLLSKNPKLLGLSLAMGARALLLYSLNFGKIDLNTSSVANFSKEDKVIT